MEVTSKTGHNLPFEEFWTLLIHAFEQRDLNCFIDILSSHDLLALKQKNQHQASSRPKAQSKSNKRYLILTFMTQEQKYHYPLALTPKDKDLTLPQLKDLYGQLRLALEEARNNALNDTAKSEPSFSINYENKKNAKQQGKQREVEQLRSEN